MRRLSIREIRAELGRLDQVVQKEGEVLITRRGVPVARLLPVKGARRRPPHADLRGAMPRLATASETLVRRDRDER
ncbi:MAG: type II toxin-antitoxin system Phd/YefM family antitoxin [Gammaproteobacteria bacterium]